MSPTQATGIRLSYKRPDDRPDFLQLVRPLGGGGTATVFEANCEARAVVKLPRRDLFQTSAEQASLTKAELAREMQMLMRVTRSTSPDRFHLAELLGAGLLADGVPYLVMRYVDGKNLAEIIDEAYEDLQSYPSMQMVVGSLLGAARGVRMLHANGILHRDIKPNNIVVPLGQPQFAVLVDLGTAKPESAESDSAAPGEVGRDLGPIMNRLYAAPEYVTSGHATVATDLYALGITAFEALTGLLPHEIELARERGVPRLSVSDLQRPAFQLRLAAIRAEAAPEFPDGIASRLPPLLAETVRRLLDPDPRNRLSSADEFVQILEQLACAVEGNGLLYRFSTSDTPAPSILSHAPHDAPAPVAQDDADVEDWAEEIGVPVAVGRSRSGGARWAFAAAVALGAVGAIGLLEFADDAPPENPAASAELAAELGTGLEMGAGVGAGVDTGQAAAAAAIPVPAPLVEARAQEEPSSHIARRGGDEGLYHRDVRVETSPGDVHIECAIDGNRPRKGLAPLDLHDVRIGSRVECRSADPRFAGSLSIVVPELADWHSPGRAAGAAATDRAPHTAAWEIPWIEETVGLVEVPAAASPHRAPRSLRTYNVVRWESPITKTESPH